MKNGVKNIHTSKEIFSDTHCGITSVCQVTLQKWKYLNFTVSAH